MIWRSVSFFFFFFGLARWLCWLVSWLVDDGGSCYKERVAIERSKLRKKVMGQSWRQDKSSPSSLYISVVLGDGSSSSTLLAIVCDILVSIGDPPAHS
jgi:hypothetical protein